MTGSAPRTGRDFSEYLMKILCNCRVLHLQSIALQKRGPSFSIGLDSKKRQQVVQSEGSHTNVPSGSS